MDERTSISETPCWIRLGEPCRLCMPGATGPGDCGLVYLVLADPQLRTELERWWADGAVRSERSTDVR